MLMLRLKQQKQIWDHLQCVVPSDKRNALFKKNKRIVLFNFPATVVTNKRTKIYGMIPARNMSSSGEMNVYSGIVLYLYAVHWQYTLNCW